MENATCPSSWELQEQWQVKLKVGGTNHDGKGWVGFDALPPYKQKAILHKQLKEGPGHRRIHMGNLLDNIEWQLGTPITEQIRASLERFRTEAYQMVSGIAEQGIVSLINMRLSTTFAHTRYENNDFAKGHGFQSVMETALRRWRRHDIQQYLTPTESHRELLSREEIIDSFSPKDLIDDLMHALAYNIDALLRHKDGKTKEKETLPEQIEAILQIMLDRIRALTSKASPLHAITP